MNTKLTLKLDKNVIQNAKAFASKNNVSLSALVEQYFKSITGKSNKTEPKLTPTVKSLLGILQAGNKIKPDDLRDEYLLEKYLNE